MKILLVTNMYPTTESPYYGIFVAEQEKALKRIYPDIEIDVFFIDGRKGYMEYFRSIFSINQKIRNQKYDLIHIHYGLSGLFLLLPFRFHTPSVIITLHGGDIQAEQGKNIQVLLTKKILKHADFAITLNERMDSLVQRFCPLTACIPCSVDTSLFTPSLKTNSIRKISRPVIVFPSSHTRMVKNYPLFLQTMEILKSEYDLDCQEIEICNMSRQQVAEAYQRADAMLMTSISEGSPQVVKEAMACNLPVVSTPVGDVNVLLKGVAGCAVSQKHDSRELAKLLYASLSGQISGVSPREKIMQLGLDEKSTCEAIKNIYQSCISH